MKLKFTHFFAFIFLAAAFVSCKKTVELPALPKSNIVTYKVVNLPDTVIYGAIDQIEKSITVYVPYYYSLNVIEPEITVTDGATITEKVAPFLISNTNIKYTVKGADATTTTYTVKVILQNPPSLTVNWRDGADPETNPLGTLPAIIGDFRSTNGDGVQMTFTHTKTGKVITAGKSTLAPFDNLYILQTTVLPVDADTGFYNVKVNFLGNTAQLKKPLHVVYIKPAVSIGFQEVKQGGTLTLTIPPPPTGIFIGLISVKVAVNGTTYDLPIQSYTPVLMKLTIPDNFPVGEYVFSNNQPVFSFEFRDWGIVTERGSLVITPK